MNDASSCQKCGSAHSESKTCETSLKSQKRTESQLKPANRFLCDLSNAGKYSYAVVCGLSLRNLYGDGADNRWVTFKLTAYKFRGKPQLY